MTLLTLSCTSPQGDSEVIENTREQGRRERKEEEREKGRGKTLSKPGEHRWFIAAGNTEIVVAAAAAAEEDHETTIVVMKMILFESLLQYHARQTVAHPVIL